MVLTYQQRWMAALLAVGLGLSLAWGFLPTVRSLQELAGHWFPSLWGRSHLLLFPLLAAAFCFSLPTPRLGPPQFRRALRIAVVPIAIAGVYGWVTDIPTLWEAYHSPHQGMLLWAVIGAPLGEELLFRGWVYRLGDRLWGEKWVFATNPVAASALVSAAAFALWHVQNLSVASPAQVTFQVGSTFFAGLWLAYLYRITGFLFVPILGHMGINAACYGFFVHYTDLIK